MNFMEAARSGKRFRKAKGPWWDRVTAGPGLTGFQIRMPSGTLIEPKIFAEDLEVDTWEIESDNDRVHALPLKEKAMMALDLFKSVIEEAMASDKTANKNSC